MIFTDSAGNELKPGDIVKMYHFTGARNRKHYMYKRFICYKKHDKKIYGEWQSLDDESHIFLDCDNKFKDVTIVVQRKKYEEKDLKKNPKFRD